MKISWVLSDHAELDPTLDSTDLKNIGSLWGGWRTWRANQTDNVICYNPTKARELLAANFQKHCNFYVPELVFKELKNAAQVQAFSGAFELEINGSEEVVALHLAASQSDIVLLLGFDLSNEPKNNPANLDYIGFVDAAIMNYTDCQWVAVNHTKPIRAPLATLPNLTTDSLENIFKAFGKL
jgi:hypothetical protein